MRGWLKLIPKRTANHDVLEPTEADGCCGDRHRGDLGGYRTGHLELTETARLTALDAPAPSVRAENVTLGYEGHPAVHHLSGTFAAGSLTAIVGPNGSGKSTLLKGIVGLIKPMGGTLAVSGGRGRRTISYLPQQAAVDRSFPISVEEMVGLGLWGEIGAFAGAGEADRSRVAQAISSVGLEGFEGRTLDTLSGGQFQRVLFARVLVQECPVILLDEPFNAIDASTSTDLMRIIERWHREKRTVIAVLHDVELARRSFPQTLLLAREKIAWGPSGVVLTPGNLLSARAMSESWDDNAPWCHRQAG